MDQATVNIVPGVSMYSVLSRLNYKPWFALAEYVDNAVQSMIQRRQILTDLHGKGYKLVVSIDTSPSEGGRIVIRDNAGGIALEDFPRAFRAAQIPADTSGLSEFGIGMKSASCWFAKIWTVRTTVVGEDQTHIVRFDVSSIVRDQTEEVEVFSIPAVPETHFTEVVLSDLHRPLAGRTIGKIRQHLTDIYRVLIREGRLDLYFNGTPLSYEEPKVLVAPYFRESEGPSLLWHKNINLDLGGGLTVSGFAALRETGSNSNAGFSLFRRGRVIEGSGDEGYRPSVIFGAGNSFKSQRLFGELHLHGFEVSHTKDGFQWDDNELVFLELLLEELDANPLPLLKQALGFRKLEHNRDSEQSAEEAISRTASTMQEHLPTAVSDLALMETLSGSSISGELSAQHHRSIRFDHRDRSWNVGVEIAGDPSEPAWFNRTIDLSQPGLIQVVVRVNSSHPFLVRFGRGDSESLEVILRMAVAMVVSEVLARQSGVEMAGVMGRNVNEILTRALSNP
jgi:hypothetical protein